MQWLCSCHDYPSLLLLLSILFLLVVDLPALHSSSEDECVWVGKGTGGEKKGTKTNDLKVYWISLDHPSSRGRRDYMKQQLDKLGMEHERVDAVYPESPRFNITVRRICFYYELIDICVHINAHVYSPLHTHTHTLSLRLRLHLHLHLHHPLPLHPPLPLHLTFTLPSPLSSPLLFSSKHTNTQSKAAC